MVTRIRSLARRRFQARTNQLARRHLSTLVSTFRLALSPISRRFVFNAGLRGSPVECQSASLPLISCRFVNGAGFCGYPVECQSAFLSLFSRRFVSGAGLPGGPVGYPPTWIPLRELFLNYLPSQPSFIFRSSFCHVVLPLSNTFYPNQASILPAVPQVVNSSC